MCQRFLISPRSLAKLAELDFPLYYVQRFVEQSIYNAGNGENAPDYRTDYRQQLAQGSVCLSEQLFQLLSKN